MAVIEIPDDRAEALKARAASHGLTLEAWFAKLAEEEAPASASQEPFKTGRGMLAKYGPAPSADEIDENRRDMFRGFAQDF
jgi:plasmid stability protein